LTSKPTFTPTLTEEKKEESKSSCIILPEGYCAQGKLVYEDKNILIKKSANLSCHPELDLGSIIDSEMNSE